MAIDRFFTTACTISNPSTDPTDSTTDEEGIPTVTADEVETFCHVQPYRSDDETALGREQAQRARRVWFPADTLISYASTVTIGIERFTVSGDPGTWNVGSPGDHIATILIRQLVPGDLAGASS